MKPQIESPMETNPVDLLQALEQRALAAASALPDASEQRRLCRGIGVRVGEHRLVMEMGDVSEVLHPPRVARVPGTKKWVRGLSSLRGALLPVIDLAGFLLGHNATHSRDTRVLVIREAGLLVGLLVDEVYGLQQFIHDDYQALTREAGDAPVDFIGGSFASRGASWPVFDVKALVRATEFSQAAA